MDYGDSYNATVATFNNWRYWNYGPAGYDRTHQLVINWVYDLPKASNVLKSPLVKAVFDNWQLSGIYAWVTGAPKGVSLTLTDGADLTAAATASPLFCAASARPAIRPGTRW